MYELIKKYYRMGIYSDADLDMFVRSGDITQGQAEAIRSTAATS